MNSIRIFDILLYPKSLYKKLTDSRTLLYPGIFIVGIIDLAFPFDRSFFGYFTGKQPGVLNRNILMAFIFVIILGLIDVMFFALPISDLFKYFGKKTAINQSSGLLVKTMKIYIMVHFIIIPVNLLMYYAGNAINLSNYILLAYIFIFYFYIVMPAWFSGAITRGIIEVYGFNPMFKFGVFLVVFFWNFLLGLAFDFIVNKWVIVLMK